MDVQLIVKMVDPNLNTFLFEQREHLQNVASIEFRAPGDFEIENFLKNLHADEYNLLLLDRRLYLTVFKPDNRYIFRFIFDNIEARASIIVRRILRARRRLTLSGANQGEGNSETPQIRVVMESFNNQPTEESASPHRGETRYLMSAEFIVSDDVNFERLFHNLCNEQCSFEFNEGKLFMTLFKLDNPYYVLVFKLENIEIRESILGRRRLNPIVIMSTRERERRTIHAENLADVLFEFLINDFQESISD